MKFYNTYIIQRDLFQELLRSAKEKKRFEDLINIKMSDHFKLEYDIKKKKVFKDLNVTINFKDSEFEIQIPADLHARMATIGIDDDFESNINFIHKRWLINSDLMIKYPKPNPIFNIEKYLNENKDENNSKKIILTIHNHKNKDLDIYDDFNLYFFELLSKYENRSAFFDPDSGELNTYLNQNPLPKEITAYIDEYYSKLQIDVKDEHEKYILFNDFSFIHYFGNRLSSFGKEFLKDFVDKTITNSLLQLNNYLQINYFDSSISYSKKRTLNLSEINSGIASFGTLTSIQQVK